LGQEFKIGALVLLLADIQRPAKEVHVVPFLGPMSRCNMPAPTLCTVRRGWSQGDLPAAFAIGAETDWEASAGGYIHECAAKTDGTLWCWGNSWYGQLGNGTSWALSPVEIPEP